MDLLEIKSRNEATKKVGGGLVFLGVDELRKIIGIQCENIDELIGEVERLSRDAARWQWVREQLDKKSFGEEMTIAVDELRSKTET